MKKLAELINRYSKYVRHFNEMLLVSLIGLKVAGVITWSWLWVLSPLWIPVSIAIFLLILYLIIK